MKYSKKRNIEFLCTAFDIKNLKFLLKNGMKKIKIPSGEITNIPLLEFISKQNKKVFLSTGMSTICEIKEALHILKKNLRDDQITIMHCTSDYPAKFGDVNLDVISTFKKEFNNEIGYSDHTLGSKVSCLALALGANVIEKHITLNNSHYGPDHKASLNPTNFKLFVNSLEETRKILGSNIKKPTLKEKKNRLIVRRSIVALKNIIKGEKFTSKNIGLKRPNLGLHPNKLSSLLKKNSRMNFIKDDFIKI
jgi:N,N'-diacetyllegionaminate synthase